MAMPHIARRTSLCRVGVAVIPLRKPASVQVEQPARLWRSSRWTVRAPTGRWCDRRRPRRRPSVAAPRRGSPHPRGVRGRGAQCAARAARATRASRHLAKCPPEVRPGFARVDRLDGCGHLSHIGSRVAVREERLWRPRLGCQVLLVHRPPGGCGQKGAGSWRTRSRLKGPFGKLREHHGEQKWNYSVLVVHLVSLPVLVVPTSHLVVLFTQVSIWSFF